MSRFRLIEDPLGRDALERPSLDEVHALWDQAKRQPIPDYAVNALRRFRFGRAAR